MFTRILLALLLAANVCLSDNSPSQQEPSLAEASPDGAVILWFFWSAGCPHCHLAHPRVEQLQHEFDWLRVHSLRVDGVPRNIGLYQELAVGLGQEARSVPAFIFCGRMLTGWDGAGALERALREGLLACHERQHVPAVGGAETLVLPGLGQVDTGAWSLPTLTVVIAALDSFNPCAFFVLLFLLSLLVHAGSRRRMLLIGGCFILVSGGVYFVGMAAWLNVFALVGHLPLITTLAGLVAVIIAVFNIKDYFLLGQGVSLGLSDGQRGRLMRRMRGLLARGSLPTMLGATFSLAVVANLYELLCTAGFPMVYTRLLTLDEPAASTGYYGYLLLYNVVYIVPLLAIMAVFVFTLGQRKLQEREGRLLKLLSGDMMLALGLALLFAPDSLNQPLTAVFLLAAAIAVTMLVAKLTVGVGHHDP